MFKRRLITLALVAVGLLSGCSAVTQKQDTSHTYHHDLEMIVNGAKCNGVCVVKKAPQYKIEISSDRIDSIFFETNSRFIHMEDMGDRVSYNFVPQELESQSPLEVVVLDKKKGRNGFGFIAFEGPDWVLPSQLSCNGEKKAVSGVAICQSKAGKEQLLEFPDDVMFHERPECPMKVIDSRHFKIELPKGKCYYVFAKKGVGFYKLLTIGTDDTILKEL